MKINPRVTFTALLVLAAASAIAQDWREADDLPLLSPEDYDAAMPSHGLSNVIVYCNAGHGLTADDGDAHPQDGDRGWYTQRPLTHGMIEDFGNIDQLDYFARYCLAAGATVVPMRPVGFQPLVIVLDNTDSVSVTFQGEWKDSESTVFFGSGEGAPYRYAVASERETATVRYKPSFAESGYYPVYTWVRPGADRVPQTYRIGYSGGVEERTVNHRRVGRGWIWLGNYWFEKGASGYVEIGNGTNEALAGHGVVVADAIRFGNGMGDIDRGVGVSGFAREFEASRYWVEGMMGNGGDRAVYDAETLSDQNDNVGAPARMAAVMNREEEGDYFSRVYISFHTNASGKSRGVLALANREAPTRLQAEYAGVLHDEVANDMEASDDGVGFMGDWIDTTGRVLAAIFGELNNDRINGEMTSTIIEVAFHDKAEDAAIMVQPAARDVAGRASYQGIVRFLQTVDTVEVPATLLPEPPTDLVVSLEDSGRLSLSWAASVSDGVGGDAADGYTVWTSTNGRGFSRALKLEGGSTTTVRGIDYKPGSPLFLRVTAHNAGGESLPSLPVVVDTGSESPWLIVNGRPRNDASLLPTITLPENAGSTNAGGATVSILRGRSDSQSEQMLRAAELLREAQVPFLSCTRDSAIAPDFDLNQFPGILWINANEPVGGDVFEQEKAALREYLASGGRLLVVGGALRWGLFEGQEDKPQSIVYNLKAVEKLNNTQRLRLETGDGTSLDGLVPFMVAVDEGDVYSSRAGSRSFPSGFEGLRDLSLYTKGLSGYCGAEARGEQWRLFNFAFPLETISPPGAATAMMDSAIRFLRDGE